MLQAPYFFCHKKIFLRQFAKYHIYVVLVISYFIYEIFLYIFSCISLIYTNKVF